jgi:hypothetical protein
MGVARECGHDTLSRGCITPPAPVRPCGHPRIDGHLICAGNTIRFRQGLSVAGPKQVIPAHHTAQARIKKHQVTGMHQVAITHEGRQVTGTSTPEWAQIEWGPKHASRQGTLMRICKQKATGGGMESAVDDRPLSPTTPPPPMGWVGQHPPCH